MKIKPRNKGDPKYSAPSRPTTKHLAKATQQQTLAPTSVRSTIVQPQEGDPNTQLSSKNRTAQQKSLEQMPAWEENTHQHLKAQNHIVLRKGPQATNSSAYLHFTQPHPHPHPVQELGPNHDVRENPNNNNIRDLALDVFGSFFEERGKVDPSSENFDGIKENKDPSFLKVRQQAQAARLRKKIEAGPSRELLERVADDIQKMRIQMGLVGDDNQDDQRMTAKEEHSKTQASTVTEPQKKMAEDKNYKDHEDISVTSIASDIISPLGRYLDRQLSSLVDDFDALIISNDEFSDLVATGVLSGQSRKIMRKRVILGLQKQHIDDTKTFQNLLQKLEGMRVVATTEEDVAKDDATLTHKNEQIKIAMEISSQAREVLDQLSQTRKKISEMKDEFLGGAQL